MDNIKSALAHLQSAVVFMPDSEAQIEVEDAIRDLRKELEDMAESPSAADEICYRCKNMCGIRRRYIGGVMRMCGKFERMEKK
jgi:DNA repair ATPase RecN